MKLFSRSGSPWNTPLPVDAPISPNSAAMSTDLGRMLGVGGWYINREDFSTALYRVTPNTPRVPVTMFEVGTNNPYVPNSNGSPHAQLAAIMAAGVPIPVGAQPAAGSDKHMCIVDTVSAEYWDFWNMEFNTLVSDGWSALHGGYMPSHKINIGRFENRDYPRGHAVWGGTGTSLPMAAGLILDEELSSGLIPHALQVVLPEPHTSFVWPAQRSDGFANGVIPEGSIARIKRSVNIASYPHPIAQVIAKALQDYGMIVNDKNDPGSKPCFRAEYTNDGLNFAARFGAWPNDILGAIPASDFEWIDPSYRPATAPAANSIRERWGINVSFIGDPSFDIDNALLTESGDTLTTEDGNVLAFA